MNARKAPPDREERDPSAAHQSGLTPLVQDISGGSPPKPFPSPALVSLSGNDYLGLSFHPAVTSASSEATRKYGTGATGSRFLSGNHHLNGVLEERIALFKGPGSKNRGIVFSSGYHANLSVMSILGPHVTFVYSDSNNHASLIDGLRLSRAKVLVYPHNDWEWVARHVTSHGPRSFLIATESLFSMGGDRAPIRELYLIAQRSGGVLVLDDAHGTGTSGQSGRGGLEEAGIPFDPEFMIITGTFSKALGSLGGYAVLGNRARDLLVSRARPFIYTTALPPGVVAASIAALEVLERNPSLVRDLQQKSSFWNNGLSGKDSSSPIIPIRGETRKLVFWSSSLEQRGFSLPVLRHPTVPKGSECLRLSVNTHWTRSVEEALEKIFGSASGGKDTDHRGPTPSGAT